MERIHSFLPTYRIAQEFLSPPMAMHISGKVILHARGIGNQIQGESKVRFSQMCRSLKVIPEVYQQGSYNSEVFAYTWSYHPVDTGRGFKKFKFKEDGILRQIMEDDWIPHLAVVNVNNDGMGEFRDQELPRLQDQGYQLSQIKLDFSPMPVKFLKVKRNFYPILPYSLTYNDRVLNPDLFKAGFHTRFESILSLDYPICHQGEILKEWYCRVLADNRCKCTIST